ncbi:hypothetical protein [Limibacillus sp. MBR-115]|jgi:hypothetical protein|uniref:DUF6973 domain-containing protein n=1 Tax=Limibacillus sp. MBR-115 TaxID=3156465 RepID=UPI00339903CE
MMAALEEEERIRQAGPADGIQIASADTGIQSDAAAPLGQQAQTARSEPARNLQVAQAPSRHGKSPAKQNQPIILPEPTADGPVVTRDLERILQFDPNGHGELSTSIRSPIDTMTAKNTAEEAILTTEKLAKSGRISGSHNGGADAFRHALWHYKLTKSSGYEASKGFGDAHERDIQGGIRAGIANLGRNPRFTPLNGAELVTPGERLMDLYNNEVGRQLALDPRNLSKPDEDVILDALSNNKLRDKPFKVV